MLWGLRQLPTSGTNTPRVSASSCHWWDYSVLWHHRDWNYPSAYTAHCVHARCPRGRCQTTLHCLCARAVSVMRVIGLQVIRVNLRGHLVAVQAIQRVGRHATGIVSIACVGGGAVRAERTSRFLPTQAP